MSAEIFTQHAVLIPLHGSSYDLIPFIVNEYTR